jgi:ABC-type multidrug transport system fused ATPase/permease subunit
MSPPSDSAGQGGGVNIPGHIDYVGDDIVGRDKITIYNYFYSALEPAAGSEDIGACPYPGLAYFGPNDATLFFGRDAAIDRLTEAVGRQSFTALVGASGSGKSSVVLAGLAPHLKLTPPA